MTETRHWGKAGQRLSAREVEQQRRARGRENFLWQRMREKAFADARRAWEAGQLQPWRITHALADMSGPEVDRACGVAEPTVDHWELGIVYPTWQQLEALAELTGYPVAFFCQTTPPLLASETTLRFHLRPWEIDAGDEEASRRFTPDAIERTLRAEGVLS